MSVYGWAFLLLIKFSISLLALPFNLNFGDDVNGLVVLLDVVQVEERHHVQQQEEGGSSVLKKNNFVSKNFTTPGRRWQ